MATNKNAENGTENTESTETEDTKQVLFKVSKDDRDRLKIVATLEGREGLQDLFSHISAELIERHAESLNLIFAARNKAAA